MAGRDYLVVIRQISESDSETTVARSSQRRGCRSSECEPAKHDNSSLTTISTNVLIIKQTKDVTAKLNTIHKYK